MVMQWLNIMEGTPGASNVSDDASSTVVGFTGTLAERITASIDKITTEYLGAAKPHFVAVGVTMAALAGSYALWEIGKGVVSYWLAGPLRLGANIKKYGLWAVVTGANTGIGRVYCLELAAKGYNIVLVSRNQEKLEVTAREVQDVHHVEARVIQVDFATGRLQDYLHVQAQLQGLDIGVLVNNAGIGPEDPATPFLDNPPDAQSCLDQINVNCASYTMMTRMILPQMVVNRRGIIINISSIAGDDYTPNMAMYSATKAFSNFFSQALAQEYKSKGIIVQSVMPGPVMTKMVQEKDKKGLAIVTPEDFVPPALAQVGLRNATYGHWKHALYMKRRKMGNWFMSLL
ncbi:hypothetical protein RvY_12659 [Ramazzottius varieornatus]|uniref:Uncharacterized protein n=1 Tax=Ramazzottius varieornatus TaxID=947166 RepID=A0A1D1VMI7_RAMVA|nr:hypothetical protein RvY_12659 [Ramazzottius varieornatus]